MTADVPEEFSGDLQRDIRVGLLRIHSKYLAKVDPGECLREGYDIYAGLLQRAGWPLTDTLLTESIPAWIFRWAIARGWLIYPPQRLRRNKPASSPGRYTSSHEPVPEGELTVPFGLYKVTDWYKANVMKRLVSRIAHWQAEALASAVQTEPARTQTPTATNRTNEQDRRQAVNAYIDEVFNMTGKRITRTDIWKSARYKSRTEFERWERRDRRATPIPHRCADLEILWSLLKQSPSPDRSDGQAGHASYAMFVQQVFESIVYRCH